MPDVKPVPDGYPRVSPSLTFDGDGCSAAIDFYTKVLGATERLRMPAPGGKVAHAKLQLGGSVINLSDENPGQGYRGPKAVGGTPVVLNVYVDDVDATFKRAIAAGAKALRPVENVFYGDRIGYFEDPWGHIWGVSTHVKDVPAWRHIWNLSTPGRDGPPEELATRVEQPMGG
jgi:PhnB protein